jgi:hypothetical protein
MLVKNTKVEYHLPKTFPLLIWPVWVLFIAPIGELAVGAVPQFFASIGPFDASDTAVVRCLSTIILLVMTVSQPLARPSHRMLMICPMLNTGRVECPLRLSGSSLRTIGPYCVFVRCSTNDSV